MSRNQQPGIAAMAAMAAVASLAAGAAVAQVHPETPTYSHEKCYGIAKSGMNDCGSPANACGATSTRDNDPAAWIYVPKGTCLKVTGGKLEPAKS